MIEIAVLTLTVLLVWGPMLVLAWPVRETW